MLPVASREKIALISAAIMQGYILAVSLEIVQTWLFSSGSAPWSAALRTCPTNSIIPRCFFEMCADNASRFCSIPFLPLKETPFLTAKSAKKDSNAFAAQTTIERTSIALTLLVIIFAKVITAQSFVQSCDFLVFSHNLRSFLRF